MSAGHSHVNLLVVSNPSTPELSVLQKLPSGVQIVATGQTLADFSQLSEQQWGSIDVMLNCGVGKNAGKRDDVRVRVRTGGLLVLIPYWILVPSKWKARLLCKTVLDTSMWNHCNCCCLPNEVAISNKQDWYKASL